MEDSTESTINSSEPTEEITSKPKTSVLFEGNINAKLRIEFEIKTIYSIVRNLWKSLLEQWYWYFIVGPRIYVQGGI